jgi:thioredoxin-related protein
MLLAVAALLGLVRPAAAGMEPGDDGLYHTDWMVVSLGDLRDDHADAAAQGKRFAVVWEQKGCSYCRQMHTRHLADPAIAGWIKDHYALEQLDVHGGRIITDFDGERLSEAALARKYGIRTTPTIQFFPKDPKAILGRSGAAIEVVRMPGLLPPADFLDVFRSVVAWNR